MAEAKEEGKAVLTWWVKKGLKKIEMRQKTRNQRYGADDQNWNDGYWANDDLYFMGEYGYF
jgi:hypothetical protein